MRWQTREMIIAAAAAAVDDAAVAETATSDVVDR